VERDRGVRGTAFPADHVDCAGGDHSMIPLTRSAFWGPRWAIGRAALTRCSSAASGARAGIERSDRIGSDGVGRTQRFATPAMSPAVAAAG
jgi:hypothetical protein